MKRIKIIGIWVMGLVITLAAAKYQRSTGPTHPFETTVSFSDQSYDLELIRSGSISKDAEVVLEIDDPEVVARLSYRKFPTDQPFQSIDFTNREGKLIAYLPTQPMAGKLSYFVEIEKGEKKVSIPHQVIRFKGDVPYAVLIPHIFFMFLTMFLSNVAGLFASFNMKRFKSVAFLTFIALAAGGMILGPIVQKYAFNEFWAGVPFGWDLTDNKTLIAFVFWFVAILANYKKPSKSLTIVAAIATLIIFAIPHSMFGSELDPETGKIIQGAINLRMIF